MSFNGSLLGFGPLGLAPIGGIVPLTQYLTPGLVAADDAIYAPTAAPGAVTAAPDLVAADDAIYAPTAAPGAVTAAPDLVDDSANDVAYSPAASSSGAIAPGLVAGDDQIFSATIASAAVLNPALVADADVFFAPDLFGSATVVLPALVADADMFPPPAAAPGVVTAAPSLVNDADTTFPPIVAARGALAPAIVIDTDATPAPTLSTGPVSLHPALYIAADIFYTPAVQGQKKTGGGGGGAGGGVTSDIKYATALVMPETGLLTAVGAQFSAAHTVNTRMMVYADAGGAPGALLATSGVHAAVTIGDNTYVLLTPWAVLSGQTIWIALHTDGNVNWFLNGGANGSRYNNDLFSDGPSDPFGASSVDNKKAPVFAIFLTAANAAMAPDLALDPDQVATPVLSTLATMAPGAIIDADAVQAPAAASVDFEAPPAPAADDMIAAPAVTSIVTLLPGLVIESDIIAPIVLSAPGFIVSAEVDADDRVFEIDAVTAGASSAAELVDADDIFFAARIDQAIAADLVDDPDTVPAPAAAPADIVLAPELVADFDDVTNAVSEIDVFGGDRAMSLDHVDDDDIIYAAAIVPVLVAAEEYTMRNRVYRSPRELINEQFERPAQSPAGKRRAMSNRIVRSDIEPEA